MPPKSIGGAYNPTADYDRTGATDTGGTYVNPSFSGGSSSSGNGTAATGVTATETGVGAFHKTVLSFTALAMAISDANVGGGVKLYTFPEGNITILGAVATVAETTTSVLASTLNASAVLSAGIGSVQTTTQASGTLVTTQQDIVNAFAVTASATINVAGAAANGKQLGTTTIRLDGTTTPQPIWLNAGVVTNTDIDADATSTWTGTVTVTWVQNGDY